jgi:pheromone shutdown protein TraB
LAAKERLKSRILRMLKEDEEFRYAVAGLLGLEEILKRLYGFKSVIEVDAAVEAAREVGVEIYTRV